MMHDGKALQAATSHYFGDGFAKAFDIMFTDKDNKKVYPHQTSWGMHHPYYRRNHHDPRRQRRTCSSSGSSTHSGSYRSYRSSSRRAFSTRLTRSADSLKAAGIRVKVDDSDNSPGWKFAQYEMKGVPLRIEIGPKDIEQNQCVIVTRHNREKSFVCSGRHRRYR